MFQFVTAVQDTSDKMVTPYPRMIWLWCQKHRDITPIQRQIKKQYRLIFPMRSITFIKHLCPDITHYSHHNYCASSRHQTVSSSWIYIVFAIMWHKHIRYITNNRKKKMILNTNIFWSIFGCANCESLYFIGFAVHFKMFLMNHGILHHFTILMSSNFLNLRCIKILWLNEELPKQ